MGIGKAIASFAGEVKGPWAAISDCRKMPIADRDGRKEWVRNMELAMDAGLVRWAVVTEKHTTALQTRSVAEVARVAAITHATFDYDEAVKYVKAIADVAA